MKIFLSLLFLNFECKGTEDKWWSYYLKKGHNYPIQLFVCFNVHIIFFQLPFKRVKRYDKKQYYYSVITSINLSVLVHMKQIGRVDTDRDMPCLISRLRGKLPAHGRGVRDFHPRCLQWKSFQYGQTSWNLPPLLSPDGELQKFAISWKLILKYADCA